MKLLAVLVLQGLVGANIARSGLRPSVIDERGFVPEPEPVGEHFEAVGPKIEPEIGPKERLNQARLNLYAISSNEAVDLIDFGIQMSVRNFLNQTVEFQQEECEKAYDSSIDIWNEAFQNYCKQLSVIPYDRESDSILGSGAETRNVYIVLALLLTAFIFDQ